MKRTSHAVWHGSGKAGSGTVTLQSKALENVSYAWNTRFEEEKGTNPEELIAAAHASCFTMKLSFVLNEAGITAEEIHTACTITLESAGITGSHLVVKARVPGISREKFSECAEKAKRECPVSKALGIPITMEIQD